MRMGDKNNKGIVTVESDRSRITGSYRFFRFDLVVILVSIDPTRLKSMGHSIRYDFSYAYPCASRQLLKFLGDPDDASF